ncbi:Inosine/uridine-preferring nucleoside hydrolase domain-containing protein [Microdochium trichocladiopsis]|uniref:Inosine/uridine-preferring nucleoside hydrolase domain-containing protein n=1 Tax=Microdochium trichocladiopsis TaxID=1682393 RepID=A0A9P8Y0W2_9PEZI|nr:Inosine/uridine-preferring nucleoside hydrolase domain-containing protein [Microdochium trichocladiopsis]KAH7024787.1 Inosine/uridine-preferring nucleoside hydrolase domain-containing protein [Microdochium trichocladiopsis]
MLFLSSLLTLASTASCSAPKIIIDNDWTSVGFVTFLLAVDAGWDVLGLVGDTANSWARQTSLHGLALLEIGNLSCIPVHKGADYPLLNTPTQHQTWELLHGPLPYISSAGAFKPENATAEALGNDPTSGDPTRISRAAFIEGFPNTTLAGETAAAWMVEQVRKYPGQVTIYSGGALTNVALAVRLDPTFASNAKGLVIMGGYLDVMMLQTTGTRLLADINSDINLKVDPEAAKIALTANFPNITIVGNGANQVFPVQEYLDEVYQVETPYTKLFHDHYGTRLPFWDEIAMFAGLYPEHVVNSTSFLVDVDTAWSSPYYGNIMVYQELLMPKVQKLQKAQYINEINQTALLSAMKRSMECPKCATFCK